MVNTCRMGYDTKRYDNLNNIEKLPYLHNWSLWTLVAHSGRLIRTVSARKSHCYMCLVESPFYISGQRSQVYWHDFHVGTRSTLDSFWFMVSSYPEKYDFHHISPSFVFQLPTISGHMSRCSLRNVQQQKWEVNRNLQVPSTVEMPPTG